MTEQFPKEKFERHADAIDALEERSPSAQSIKPPASPDGGCSPYRDEIVNNHSDKLYTIELS